MPDCLFCKIIRGELPAAFVYDTPTVTAFRDIYPAAPVHILIVPKRHIADIRDEAALRDDILSDMFKAANAVAAQEGIARTGYRLMFNYGDDANLMVPHLHLHLLGGRPLGPMVMPVNVIK